MIKPAPIQDITLDRQNRFSPRWVQWLQSVYRVLSGKEPLPLASYTVALLPPAADYPAHVVYVSNEAGGATIAFSDSINWRRVQDRAIVS